MNNGVSLFSMNNKVTQEQKGTKKPIPLRPLLVEVVSIHGQVGKRQQGGGQICREGSKIFRNFEGGDQISVYLGDVNKVFSRI